MPPPEERLALAYAARTGTLADDNGAAVAALWTALIDSEDPDPERFAALAGTRTAIANRAAVVLADRYVADALTLALREPVIVEAADVARYANPRVTADSYLSIIRDDGTEVARPRLRRVAESEPLAAGHARHLHHVRRSPHGVRWVRVVAGRPCNICGPRGGETIDPAFGVSLHTHCQCTSMPTT